MTTSVTPRARHEAGRPETVQAAARRGRSDRSVTVFTVATVLGLVHAVDDALLHRQPGVPLTQHLPALVVVLAVTVPVLLLFSRMRTGLRAAAALAIGAVTLTNGGLHLAHVVVDGPTGSDLTGVVAAGAGVVLLLLAAWLPVSRRGERPYRRPRRWAVRALVTATVVLLVPTVLVPVCVGIGQTHLFRTPVGAPPDGFDAVSFASRDGLELSGWYRSSTNGAAVILVNTAGGDRLGSVQHARLLARHGYGVLLYDARGAGESEGSPNGYGWDWEHDLRGALDFLETRPDVAPGRIGALGLSTGADVAIATAAVDDRLRAVVADGATVRSFGDIPPEDRWANAYMAPLMATVRVLSGSDPGPRLVDLVEEVSPTPLLLVAAGSIPGEIAVNEGYAAAAEEPVELWSLPDAAHTAAIRDEAAAYERRVVGHFDAALLGTP